MRNNSIDTLKFICAVLVIFIHTVQPTCVEPYIDPLKRCAVPVFFIISGYLTFGKTKLNDIICKRLIYIFKLCCWGFLLYLTIFILHSRSLHFIDIIQQGTTSLIAFNNIMFGAHLWYIHAYLYVLIVLYFVNKYNLYRQLFIATPLLLIIGLAIGKYNLCENKVPLYYSRNFLFTGLPFFSIGLLLKKYEVFINTHIKKLTVLLVFIVSYTIGVIGCIAFNLHNKIGDIYITTIFASVTLFLYFKNIKTTDNSFSRIGREDSLYIYIFHMAVVNEIYNVFAKVGLLYYYRYFSSALVLIATISLIKILRKAKIIGKLI